MTGAIVGLVIFTVAVIVSAAVPDIVEFFDDDDELE